MQSAVSVSHGAVCGKLSLGVFLGSLGALLSLVFFGLRHSGESGWGYACLGVLIGWWGSMLSLLLATAGLLRRERPNWPAIIGLSVSLAPTVAGWYLYFAGK